MVFSGYGDLYCLTQTVTMRKRLVSFDFASRLRQAGALMVSVPFKSRLIKESSLVGQIGAKAAHREMEGAHLAITS